MAAQANLPPNSLTANQVDLEQGAMAWEVFAKSLAQGKTVQDAVDDANTYLRVIYPMLPPPPPPQTKGVLVIFKVVGNGNVCPRCYH